MTADRTLLLSLRPRFAGSILAGTKTIEIRRRSHKAAGGTPIIRYVSSPVMAVVGTARLVAVHVLPVERPGVRFRAKLG